MLNNIIFKFFFSFRHFPSICCYYYCLMCSQVTQRKDTIAVMSCNPSIGGNGKGTLVREIDALGGLMARAADEAGTHFKVLNRSRGAAVQGPRALCDRDIYRSAMQRYLAALPNLTILEGSVEDFEIQPPAHPELPPRISGVRLESGEVVHGENVVMTTGTFLSGVIHIGLKRINAGRRGEGSVHKLAHTLERLQFPLGKLKTSTPARLARASIDYSVLEPQDPDPIPEAMSIAGPGVAPDRPQLQCHYTCTTPAINAFVNEHAHLGAVYDNPTGGPRYCLSAEIKANRFPERDHPVWLEPEGLDSGVVYPAGISNTLPEDVQLRFLRMIKGLERVEVLHYAYGVEYHFVDPRDAHPTLMSRRCDGLFLAGQINGTTGYEEAASQGLVAGINAALRAKAAPAFVMDRATSMIGVLIDDLVTVGTKEPYRMFTSRAEYRLSIRADNADRRLTRIGHALGVVSDEQLAKFEAREAEIQRGVGALTGVKLSPNEWLRRGFPVSLDGTMRSAFDLLRHPGVSIDRVLEATPEAPAIGLAVRSLVETEAKYGAYVAKQADEVARLSRDQHVRIPWEAIGLGKAALMAKYPFLSNEESEKLARLRPLTIGHALKISGITPASMVFMSQQISKALRRKDTEETVAAETQQ